MAPEDGYDQLYLWDGVSTSRLTGGDEHHRHPVWGGDGKLYCLAGDRGYYRPVSVDPATGGVTPFWPYRESVLGLTPTEDSFILVLYSGRRAEIYRFQPQGG